MSNFLILSAIDVFLSSRLVKFRVTSPINRRGLSFVRPLPYLPSLSPYLWGAILIKQARKCISCFSCFSLLGILLFLVCVGERLLPFLVGLCWMAMIGGYFVYGRLCSVAMLALWASPGPVPFHHPSSCLVDIRQMVLVAGGKAYCVRWLLSVRGAPIPGWL